MWLNPVLWCWPLNGVVNELGILESVGWVLRLNVRNLRQHVCVPLQKADGIANKFFCVCHEVFMSNF